MNLKKITDTELHSKTKLAAIKEKAATLELLEHLAEVSRRNLYVEYGHSTLHKYIVKELGYSGAEAWTRVNAMKLVRDDSRAKKSFAEGKLTLSNASLLQENKKALEQNFDNILADAEKLSFRELENNLRQKLGRPKRDVTIILPDRMLEKINRLKKTFGENMSELEIFEALIDEKLNSKAAKWPSTTDPVKVTRYIPVATKKLVMKCADFRCQGIHENGGRCNERRNLEIDHIKPFAAGGSRDVANLQVLCKAHNLRKSFNLIRSPRATRASESKAFVFPYQRDPQKV